MRMVAQDHVDAAFRQDPHSDIPGRRGLDLVAAERQDLGQHFAYLGLFTHHQDAAGVAGAGRFLYRREGDLPGKRAKLSPTHWPSLAPCGAEISFQSLLDTCNNAACNAISLKQ
jgi:hypothetical protein